MCAVCLFEIQSRLGRRIRAEEPITIANGQAVCEYHFVAICRKLTPDYGQVGLAFLADKRFNTTPRPEST